MGPRIAKTTTALVQIYTFVDLLSALFYNEI